MEHSEAFESELEKLPESIRHNVQFIRFTEFLRTQKIMTPVQQDEKDSAAFRNNLQLLFTLVSNLQSGILVENEHRQILFTNQQFCDIFKIPARPDDLVGMDCSGSAEASKDMMQDPVSFVRNIDKALREKKAVHSEEVVFADGSVYERDYIPLYLDNIYRGHLWEYRNITPKKTYESTILRQKEQFQSIINNMNLGLIEVDLNELIRYVNPAFMRISGYREDELIGKNTMELFGNAENKDVVTSTQDRRRRGESDSYEIKVYNKQGEERWWMVSGAPNYDESGKLKGTIGIHLDVTDTKKLRVELEAAKEKAEASSRAKATFLANMSHEIRTPLHGIMGMIRELSYEQDENKRKKYIANAAIASEHLLSVLNNILDISKIEAGELGLEKATFRLRDTLKNVKSIMMSRAREKGLFLWLDSREIRDILYIGDSLRIRQVLLNLIGNAIKFTENGGVYVECNIVDKKAGGHVIRVTVEDTGIGMDDHYQDIIFRKFSQEDNSTSRKFGGTGLGMAITAEIVQMMGGSIQVQSKKNEGTTVQIEFELPVATENAGLSDEPHLPPDIRKSRVLLVEDNEFNREVACNTLRRYKCEVKEAVNGEEALEILKAERFDVILMDLQMPVMDGFETTKRIRRDLSLDIPIIALTANAFKSELEECKRIGMNDYITKPYEEENLIGTIHRALHPAMPVKQESARRESPAASPGSKLFDLQKLRSLTGSDEHYFQKMLNIFITQTEKSVHELREALEAANMAQVGKIAHRIKPSLEHMGIDSLYQLVRTIEAGARQDKMEREFRTDVESLCSTLERVIQQLRKQEN